MNDLFSHLKITSRSGPASAFQQFPPPPVSSTPFFSNPCALLRTLLLSPKTQLLSFQAIPHSLAKTTGGGGTYANLTPSRFQIRSTTFRPFTVPRSIKTVVNHRKMQTASPNNDVASAVWGYGCTVKNRLRSRSLL